MNARCDYAGCTRLSEAAAGPWSFCSPHLREHRKLVAQDTHLERFRVAELRVEQQTRSACRGQLLPSGNIAAILDVLNRDEQQHRVAS